MRAQPRHVGGPEVRRRDFPVFHGGQQRERGIRTLQDLIEQRRRVGARQRRDDHGIHIAARRLAERGDQAAFERRRHSGVGQHRRNSGEHLRPTGGNSKQAGGAVGTALVALRGVTKIAEHELSVAVGLRAQHTCLVPLRHDRKRRGGRRGIVEQLLQGLRRLGVQVQDSRARLPSGRRLGRCSSSAPPRRVRPRRPQSATAGHDRATPQARQPPRSRSTPADGHASVPRPRRTAPARLPRQPAPIASSCRWPPRRSRAQPCAARASPRRAPARRARAPCSPWAS